MFVFNPNNYSGKQIDDALHISDKSRHISFRYDLLDRNDSKLGEIDGIESASVSHGEFNIVKRYATFRLNEYMQRNIDFMSERIQPWFVLHMPQGGTVEWPLGIFLLESTEARVTGRYTYRDIGAYDKTLIIEADRFTDNYFIPAGTNYVGAIIKILSMSGITKINIPATDQVFLSDREVIIGSKVREVVNAFLGEINYRSISVDEVGFFNSGPYIEPSGRDVTQWYMADRDSIILPEIRGALDIAGRPNVFVRVARNLGSGYALRSKIVNDNPSSPLSVTNRGRAIVDFGEISNIADQPTLNAYTRRVAINSMSAYTHLSFGSALMPGHGAAETLYCDMPMVFDAPLLFSETSWEMDLIYNGVMYHEARRVVAL